MNLKGSNVLVTGAATGIGKAIAVAMADAGAAVIAAAIDVAAARKTAIPSPQRAFGGSPFKPIAATSPAATLWSIRQ